MVLSDKEKKVMNETKLRNLKRTYAKLKEHSELTYETIKLKEEIINLEKELQ